MVFREDLLVVGNTRLGDIGDRSLTSWRVWAVEPTRRPRTSSQNRCRIVRAGVEDRTGERVAARRAGPFGRRSRSAGRSTCSRGRETPVLAALVGDRSVGRTRHVPREDQDDQGHHQRDREKQRMSATLRAGRATKEELSRQGFCYSSSKMSSSSISEAPSGSAFSSSISHLSR